MTRSKKTHTESSGAKDIGDFFLKDHVQIMKIARNVCERLVNPEELENQLRWHLERHFYIEERAFYTLLDLQNEKNPLFNRFISDHNKIFQLELKVREEPSSREWAKKILLALQDHVQFEVSEFYPLLEELAVPSTKKKMIEEIKKSISLGLYPVEKLRSFYSDKCDIEIPSRPSSNEQN